MKTLKQQTAKTGACHFCFYFSLRDTHLTHVTFINCVSFTIFAILTFYDRNLRFNEPARLFTCIYKTFVRTQITEFSQFYHRMNIYLFSFCSYLHPYECTRINISLSPWPKKACNVCVEILSIFVVISRWIFTAGFFLKLSMSLCSFSMMIF